MCGHVLQSKLRLRHAGPARMSIRVQLANTVASRAHTPWEGSSCEGKISERTPDEQVVRQGYDHTSARSARVPQFGHTSTQSSIRNVRRTYILRLVGLVRATSYNLSAAATLLRAQLFDRQMIALWLSKQGSICPLTGQPLVETELQPDEEIAAEIRAWHKNLMQQKKSASAGSHKNSKARSTATVERNERGRQGGRHEDEAIPASGDNASSCTGGRSSETHTSVGGDVTKREQSRLGELSTSVQTPVTSPARCRDQRRENSLSPPPKGRVKDDDGIVREQSKGVHDDDEHDMYDF